MSADAHAAFNIHIPPAPKELFTNQPQKVNTIERIVKCTPEQEKRLKKFIKKELKKFDKIKGHTQVLKHKIKLIKNDPVKMSYKPKNPFMQKIINKGLDEMLEDGTVEP